MRWQSSISTLGILVLMGAPVGAMTSSLPLQREGQISPGLVAGIRFGGTGSVGQPYGGTVGGGHRGEGCVKKEDTPMTPLMPKSSEGTEVMTTVAANPTIFMYIPETTAKQAEFLVVDDEGNEVHFIMMDLPGQSGIVKLSLPSTVSLDVNKNYTWQFELMCKEEDRAANPVVRGLMQRKELSAQIKMMLEQEKDQIKQAELYAKAGIWNEAMMILADMRSTYPNEWRSLLESVGLEALVEAPFVPTTAAQQ